MEIYHNGKPLGSASRFHITFDFGYFALDVGHCLASDAGDYTVKAVNKLGSAVSSTTLKVAGKHHNLILCLKKVLKTIKYFVFSLVTIIGF